MCAFKLTLLLVAAVAVFGQSTLPCTQQSVDQCASSCACQRVACCCGPNCDKTGSKINYNRCVAVGTDSSTWNCPTSDACAAYGGRAMTVTPCTGSAPTPSGYTTTQVGFGTTFPLLGTQPVGTSTWQGGVYMGTSQQYNTGAYWNYHDSYSSPITNGVQYDSAGNQIGTPGGSAPTPIIDYTGIPCYIASPCPTGYYCQVNVGNNVQQRGFCARVPYNYYISGAGPWQNSDYYNSLVHPPLVLDPDHNGPPNAVPGNGYPPYSPGIPLPNSCASPSVCGYKTATGTCWCDSKCQSTGDCCPDIGQYCGISSGGYTPAYTPPAIAGCVQDGGQCAGRCGSSAVSTPSGTCYCDSSCHNYNDCCCSSAC